MNYKKNPNWILLFENGQLVLSGGQDELYLINELNTEEAKELYEKYEKSDFKKTKNENINNVLNKLIKLGVIYPGLPSRKKINYALHFIGYKDSDLLNFLKNSNQDYLNLIEEENADLIVFLRNGKKPSDILKNYPVKKVHFLLDLANKETISLGPIVFPGQSSCLSCFIGRLNFHWGDASAPKIPLASTHTEFIASLILEQLKIFSQEGNCPALFEKVVSFNLRNLSTQSDSVYRLPWCPYCFPENKKYGEGSFELPWQ